jgi:hypothetical protein
MSFSSWLRNGKRSALAAPRQAQIPTQRRGSFRSLALARALAFEPAMRAPARLRPSLRLAAGVGQTMRRGEKYSAWLKNPLERCTVYQYTIATQTAAHPRSVLWKPI